MANNNVPTNAGQVIESPKARKVWYKIVGWAGVIGSAVTVGLAPFGITTEAAPWLLSFWAVYGVFAKFTNYTADSNVILPPGE